MPLRRNCIRSGDRSPDSGHLSLYRLPGSYRNCVSRFRSGAPCNVSPAARRADNLHQGNFRKRHETAACILRRLRQPDLRPCAGRNLLIPCVSATCDSAASSRRSTRYGAARRSHGRKTSQICRNLKKVEGLKQNRSKAVASVDSTFSNQKCV